MEQHLLYLEFDQILELLQEQALTKQAKKMLTELRPLLSELELTAAQRETTEARLLLDNLGTPPIPLMDGIEEIWNTAKKDALLTPSDLEQVGTFLSAMKRLRDFLSRGCEIAPGLSHRYEEIDCLDAVQREIFTKIRSGRIDDYATRELRDVRRKILSLTEKLHAKAEETLKKHKNYLSEHFVVTRDGHLCIPVKKEYRSRVRGSVIGTSSTGSTYFIEPESVQSLQQELQLFEIEEENEERKILYELTALLLESESAIHADIDATIKIDYAFAKGKLSAMWNAVKPHINTERNISFKHAKHPMLMGRQTEETPCIPLDFSLDGSKVRGIVITGPNTGGKTVALKTIGLLCVIAQCGLHVPCEHANICMNSQVLCDIGDGQNISQNLSTFSAHIKNVLDILSRVNTESLVLLDELGSGTDPAEGMGIAIAILEQLRLSDCLFVATTHYPEVKAYAQTAPNLSNARMAFDRETLRPLYQLEIGLAGESCALFIAGRLGMPVSMLELAAQKAYPDKSELECHALSETCRSQQELKKMHAPHIQKKSSYKMPSKLEHSFQRGDCVRVSPDQSLAIVVQPPNEKGDVLIQQKKEKRLISHKRLTLYIASEKLYPENYDFSILFDTIANRKARHQMQKAYQENLTISHDGL